MPKPRGTKMDWDFLFPLVGPAGVPSGTIQVTTPGGSVTSTAHLHGDLI